MGVTEVHLYFTEVGCGMKSWNNQIFGADGSAHDRYVIIGPSGSGKTTLAEKLTSELDHRHVELDSLFWCPDWEARPTEEFRQMVDNATRDQHWVVDGNYSVARDIVWPRADAVIWLDLPFHVVMMQVLKRTIDRVVTRRPLWNGNRTSFRRAFLSRDSVVWWAATTWKDKRDTYARLLYEPEWSHLDVFRVRSREGADVEVRRGES